MRSRWFTRLFFSVVAAFAVTGVVTGTGCTRWGQPGPVTPTVAPLSALYVSATTGSDTSGNGSMSKPYKSLTKAVDVLVAAKSLSPMGVTITMASGDYDAANGETFPIVIPTGVSIVGQNYGSGFARGVFINGSGEDTIFEKLVDAPPHSAYTTLEIVPPASVSITQVYVGASQLKLPGSNSVYESLDDIGTVSATTATFGAGITALRHNVTGVLVPGGSFSGTSCEIHGNEFGIGALSVPIATASPSSVAPSITLTHSGSDSIIAAKGFGIVTDGSVDVNVSGETFEQEQYAFSDALKPIVAVPLRGTTDFGGGASNSSGGNNFLGAKISAIFIIRRGETVSALDNVWNPNEQGSSGNGSYRRTHRFASGATGRNVTIRHDAVGSTVMVGPAPVPTPTPSISPSITPSTSPTPT
jgi:hypothetical protein